MFIIKKPNYTIEKFISNEKYTFPSVKNLNAIEVVKIYNFFSSIFPKVTKKTHSTKVARKLENILDNFDVLLLDAFGVLNCGDTLIPGIVNTINKARDRGIILIILTNGSSSHSNKKITQLYNLGLEFSFDEIISSRDLTFRFLSINKPTGQIGVLGDKEFNEQEYGLNLINLEDNISYFDLVDNILFLGTSKWDPLYHDILKETLLNFPRPFFVSNPDIVAPHPNSFSIEPAFYALHLINDGVNLPIWFGKPFPQIFDMAIERSENINGRSVNLSRVGMVGDTLHTDILGANAYGIKSILMTNHGLFKNEKISEMIKISKIIPDFIVEGP